MKPEDFVEASAYLRVLEKRILSGAEIERISEAPNTAEALRQISQNSEYDFTTLKNVWDCEHVIKSGLKNMYDLIYKLVKYRTVADLPAQKYDYHNLKVAVKARYLNKERTTRLTASLSAGYLYSGLSSLDMSAVEAALSERDEKDAADSRSFTDKPSLLPPHILSALDEAVSAFGEQHDPQDIDIVLDRHMFGRMLELCDELQNDFITGYTRYSIDFYNIKTLMRVKDMRKGTRFLGNCLVGGGLTDKDYFIANYDKQPDALASIFYYKYFGDITEKGFENRIKTGNYAYLEKLFDDYLIDYIKKSKLVAFGPEIPFAYIISKENEARQIRVLVTGKINNVRTETLKERLRDNYA